MATACVYVSVAIRPKECSAASLKFLLFLSDCDAFFRRPLSLFDFGTPLPHALGMAGEVSDIFPFNAGIMLMNIPYLKQTYPDFLRWILLQKNGLNFGGKDTIML